MPKNENDSAADEFDTGKPGVPQVQADSADMDVAESAASASNNPAPETDPAKVPPAADAAPAPAPAKKADPFTNKVFTNLPTCLRKSLEILSLADALPERNGKEETAKAAILKVVKKHCFDLQQGSVAPQVSANDIAVTSVQQTAFIKSERMKLLGRENRDVAELLAAHDALVVENAKLREQVAKKK